MCIAPDVYMLKMSVTVLGVVSMHAVSLWHVTKWPLP